MAGTLFMCAPVRVNSAVVHRFYNENTRSHFYTADVDEAESVRESGAGFHYEGMAYRAFREKLEGTTELYRFYNKDTGGHFYTASVQEMEHVRVELAGIYHFEGVAYYVAA